MQRFAWLILLVLAPSVLVFGQDAVGTYQAIDSPFPGVARLIVRPASAAGDGSMVGSNRGSAYLVSFVGFEIGRAHV